MKYLERKNWFHQREPKQIEAISFKQISNIVGNTSWVYMGFKVNYKNHECYLINNPNRVLKLRVGEYLIIENKDMVYTMEGYEFIKKFYPKYINLGPNP